MEGVILFADDEIFQDSFEKKLFEFLRQSSKHPILPINNLIDFERTIKSISTYRAILLDWEFVLKIDGEAEKRENPLTILQTHSLYSLIFIYSRATISDEVQRDLTQKFGSKIVFLPKIREDEQVKQEAEKISAAIERFQKENDHLAVPFAWSHSINKSVWNIFSELEKADKFWIKDLYYSSFVFDKKGDPIDPPPIDPNIQVINLFQNLLVEQLIQNTSLRSSIENFAKENLKNKSNEKSLQDLYKRLYYTTTLETDTVMTGDVFEISPDNFGIVISPECDINTLIKKDRDVEMLCFAISDFKNIDSILNIKTGQNRDDIINRAFNKEPPRIHLLPVFPATKGMITALIDFRFCLQHHKGSFLEENKKQRHFKINSPYIQQLRQRYLSYSGRVGVPSIPSSLRFTS
jgi:hypothetical protein